MDDLECRIAVARGDQPADLILRGGRVFDLITGTMMTGDVAICGDRIAGIGDYDGTRVIGQFTIDRTRSAVPVEV